MMNNITMRNPSLRLWKVAMRSNILVGVRKHVGDRHHQLAPKTRNIVSWVGNHLQQGSLEDLRDLKVTLEECLAFIQEEPPQG